MPWVCLQWHLCRKSEGLLSSASAEEVEALLGFLGDGCCVDAGGPIISQMYLQELGAVYPFYSRTTDGQWRMMVGVDLPEVNENLFGSLRVEVKKM